MNQQAIILCLFGKKGSGKDTFADILIRQYGKNAYKIGFADTLKQVVGTAFGFDTSQMDDFGYKEKTFDDKGVSCRRRLTEVGELFREQYGRDFWTQQLIRRIDTLLQYPPARKLIIIKDARFLDELESLQQHDFYATAKLVSIKITRYYTVEDAMSLVADQSLKRDQRKLSPYLAQTYSLRFQDELGLYELIGVNDKAESAVDEVVTAHAIKNISNNIEHLRKEAEDLLQYFF